MKYIDLSNGVKMPILGFGTFKVENGVQAVDSVKYALSVGYRHIDTAAVYGNEEGVGKAIKESGIPRDQIFLVSKVWNTDQGYETTLKAFDDSLKRLGTDYLDMYLIHWPKPLSKDTWKAMEKLYKEGYIRSIGVSNFKEHHLLDLFETAEIKPMANQVEYHPRLAQPELKAFCENHGICLVAWSPLMKGKLSDIQVIKELAAKYNKNEAQIGLRWIIQKGAAAIPKSVNPERIKSNFDIFDFELSEEDMQKISALDKGERIGPDPDNINF